MEAKHGGTAGLEGSEFPDLRDTIPAMDVCFSKFLDHDGAPSLRAYLMLQIQNFPFPSCLSECWGEGQNIGGDAGGSGECGSRGRGVVVAVPRDAPNMSP